MAATISRAVIRLSCAGEMMAAPSTIVDTNSGVLFMVYPRPSRAFVVRECLSTDVADVCFRKRADAIQACLQLVGIAFQFAIISITEHGDQFSHADQDAGEGFRDHHPVPASQNPGFLHR